MTTAGIIFTIWIVSVFKDVTIDPTEDYKGWWAQVKVAMNSE